jgi:hypothetical protein
VHRNGFHRPPREPARHNGCSQFAKGLLQSLHCSARQNGSAPLIALGVTIADFEVRGTAFRELVLGLPRVRLVISDQ